MGIKCMVYFIPFLTFHRGDAEDAEKIINLHQITTSGLRPRRPVRRGTGNPGYARIPPLRGRSG